MQVALPVANIPRFSHVIGAVHELRKAGWQIQVEPVGDGSLRKRIAMLQPGETDWTLALNPLEAMAFHFSSGTVVRTIEEQTEMLGMPLLIGHWIYALCADDRAYLEQQPNLRFCMDWFPWTREFLLTMCALPRD